jgi:hypothetical protein
MASCKCDGFGHLELCRDKITRRIKESKKLKKALSMLTRHKDGEHQLLKCPLCGQLWQFSRAWNWDNYEYLFKVPQIEIDDWLTEPYMQPDSLLIYSAVMQDFFQRNQFVEKNEECRIAACNNKAVVGLVTCLAHHIEGMRRNRALPREPEGRGFPPYDTRVD